MVPQHQHRPLPRPGEGGLDRADHPGAVPRLTGRAGRPLRPVDEPPFGVEEHQPEPAEVLHLRSGTGPGRHHARASSRVRRHPVGLPARCGAAIRLALMSPPVVVAEEEVPARAARPEHVEVSAQHALRGASFRRRFGREPVRIGVVAEEDHRGAVRRPARRRPERREGRIVPLVRAPAVPHEQHGPRDLSRRRFGHEGRRGTTPRAGAEGEEQPDSAPADQGRAQR